MPCSYPDGFAWECLLGNLSSSQKISPRVITGGVLPFYWYLERYFFIVFLNRLWQVVDACLRDQQVGFWSGRSCIEQIFVLWQVIEPSLEYQQRISLNFINFVNTFDSPRNAISLDLWNSIKIFRHLSQPLPRLSMLCMNGRKNNWFLHD